MTATVDAGMQKLGLVMPLATQQGGAERLFQNLLQTRSRLFDYRVLFLQDGLLVNEARDLGYETTVLHATHLRDLRNYTSIVHGIRQWIEQSGLDLIFSWMLKGHLYAGPAALLSGRKRMWFQHGISKRHWMDVLGTCLPTDGILCCSNYVKHTQDMRFPAQPTFACHPGINLPVFDVTARTTARARLGIASSDQVVCMVARLERWKGIHIFIEAARLLAQKCPKAVFCVAGGTHPLDQAYAAKIYQLSVQSGLGERLLLLGQLPPGEIPLWHAGADVIVHSVTEAEPFGMAIVEALAMGRAVVASKAGGISEIIEDGVSGVFVPPGDAVALAGEMHRLLADVEARERIEAAALIRSHKFSVDAFKARFENLILSVISA